MTNKEFMAFSFPYNLQVEWIRTDDNTKQISSWNIFDAPFFYKKEFKPILRNLSDLTKPIEHKGDKFVPAVRLSDYYRDYPHEVKLDIECQNISLEHALKLIEWHFDLFGGVDNGEAIDVNTLEANPYK